MGRRDIAVACVLLVFLLFLRPDRAVAELTICNHSPYKVQFAIFGGVANNIVGEGWYDLDHGDCGDYWSGDVSHHNFYVHAEAIEDLADWVHEGPLIWGYRHTQVCVPLDPFSRSPVEYIINPLALSGFKNPCTSDQRPIRIQQIKSQSEKHASFQWNISVDSFPVFSNFYTDDWRRVLQGRMDYERIIIDQRPRFPFRIGVSFVAADSLVIEKVHEGLPGSALGLVPGDQIHSVGDQEVKSPFELVDALNSYGFEYGFGQAVQISLVRNDQLLEGYVDLEYYYELDPRRNNAESSEASLAAAWDSAWLGYGSFIRCGGAALIEDGFYWLFNDDNSFYETRRVAECTEWHEAYLDRLQAMYPDEYGVGDFAGGFVGGLRVLPKAWFRLGTRQAARLMGSRSIARILVQSSTDAADGFLTVIGQSSATQSIDDVFDEAVRAGKLGGGVSALINGVVRR